MNTATSVETPPEFKRIDPALYRARLMEQVGFSELEMDLLMLESGCRFLEAFWLQDAPNTVPNGYTPRCAAMLMDRAWGFWPAWRFIFLNRCVRMVMQLQSYEGTMELLGDGKGRERTIAAFMDLIHDQVCVDQFDVYLKRLQADQHN